MGSRSNRQCNLEVLHSYIAIKCFPKLGGCSHVVLSHDEVFLHKNGDAVSLQFRPKSLVISSVTETGNVVYTFFLVHYFFELNYHVMQSHCKHGKILYFDSCIRLGHEQCGGIVISRRFQSKAILRSTGNV